MTAYWLTPCTRGAECWTGHHLVWAKIQLPYISGRPKIRKQKPCLVLKVAAIKQPETWDMLQQWLAEKLQQIPNPEPTNNKDKQYVQNREIKLLISCNWKPGQISHAFGSIIHIISKDLDKNMCHYWTIWQTTLLPWTPKQTPESTQELKRKNK